MRPDIDAGPIWRKCSESNGPEGRGSGSGRLRLLGADQEGLAGQSKCNHDRHAERTNVLGQGSLQTKRVCVAADYTGVETVLAQRGSGGIQQLGSDSAGGVRLDIQNRETAVTQRE